MELQLYNLIIHLPKNLGAFQIELMLLGYSHKRGRSIDIIEYSVIRFMQYLTAVHFVVVFGA